MFCSLFDALIVEPINITRSLIELINALISSVIFCQHTCFHTLKLYVFHTLKPEKVTYCSGFKRISFFSLICKFMEHGPLKTNQIIDSAGGERGGSIKFPSCVVIDLCL